MSACTHLAEDVLPGHPDRLADTIAEAVVDAALAWDSQALVGVEVAVHRDSVFVTGRVAATKRVRLWIPIQLNLDQIVADALRRCRYTGRWAFQPRIETDLDQGGLGEEEREIRGYSDDQSITIGYAGGNEQTRLLPPAVYAARQLKNALFCLRGANPDLLGPDGKVLVELDETDGRYRLRHCTVSIQHADGVDYERPHALALPRLRATARRLDRALPGLAAGWDADLVRLNGAGDFSCGGTHGDNGLSGKKLVVDHYGPHVPIGGGALCGKDPRKVDRIGALCARQLAVRLHRAFHPRETLVQLGYAPGLTAPRTIHATTDGDPITDDELRNAIAIPNLAIEASYQRLDLHTVRWQQAVGRGYFGNDWSWER